MGNSARVVGTQSGPGSRVKSGGAKVETLERRELFAAAPPLDPVPAVVDPAVTTQPGLTGNYFGTTDLNASPVLTRVDPSVNFNWKKGSPDAAITAVDGFAVRWSGRVQAKYSETYTFSIKADEGVRLSLGGALVIDTMTNK